MLAEATRTKSGWCWVRPTCVDWLAELGLQAARDFLALPGVVISGHVGRNVSRVHLGDTVGYLKREHSVRVRDRLRSLLAGFGPVSLAQREQMVIARMDAHMLQSPYCLAAGEGDGQAFLLLEQAHGAIELRRLPKVGEKLAEQLGHIIAGIHAAGIDQPDLFAKHFLINPDTEHVTIIDWQRALLRGSVPWRRRIRSLAALRATISDELLSAQVWNRLLAAYVNASTPRRLPALRARIERIARELRQRPAIRSQLKPPAAEQELVRIGGEKVCAIPEIAHELQQPDVVASLYDPDNHGRTFRFRNRSTGVLSVSRYRSPLARWWALVRGKAWRSDELRTARLLFHLERYGIPAPRLLAYGQQVHRLVGAGSFVLAEPRDVRAVRPSDAPTLVDLLERLHDAGCCLGTIDDQSEPFGMDGASPAVADIQCVRMRRRLSSRQIERDRARMNAFLGARR